jgi:anti-anti-sigma regulatory factor
MQAQTYAPTSNAKRPTFAVHLVGNMDADATDAMSAALWKLSETGDPKIVVVADHLRLRNFWDFRTLAESIQSLRSLGRDVKISVTSPQMRAVLSDLHLDDACVYGDVRADHRVLVGSPTVAYRRAS